MERVAFLIEATGLRIPCLLNPASMVVRRTAGLRPRRAAGGKLTGISLSDDPVIYTGGGRTEVLVDLLFDVQIAGSSIQADDVRTLTRPLWDLAENGVARDGSFQPSLVRFVWGKAWNIPGVVAAVAERLEQFTSGGVPLRSWMRMRLLRVSEAEAQTQDAPMERGLLSPSPEDRAEIPEDQVAVHQVLGGGTEGGERLEDIAFLHYGDPSAWRVIASFNGMTDPRHIPPGTILRLPPAAALGPG